MRGGGVACTAAVSPVERALGRNPLRSFSHPSPSKAKPQAGMICSNKHCRRTSPGDGPTCRWHVRNYGSEEEPVHVTLCNACKINFDQGKYCPFCVQIYREKDPDSFDGKEWIGCTNKGCRRWVHVDCELAENADATSESVHHNYQCPPCRERVQHAESSERRRLGRHNAADRLAAAVGERQLTPSLTMASEGDACKPERSSSRNMSPPENVPVLSKSFSWNGARVSAPRSDSRPGSPSSSLRQTPPVRVDLSKLQANSLKRYKKVYKLSNIPSGCKMEGLKMAVAQHFATLVVNEEDTFRSFVQSCLRRQQGSLATVEHAASLRTLRKIPKAGAEQGVS